MGVKIVYLKDWHTELQIAHNYLQRTLLVSRLQRMNSFQNETKRFPPILNSSKYIVVLHVSSWTIHAGGRSTRKLQCTASRLVRDVPEKINGYLLSQKV